MAELPETYDEVEVGDEYELDGTYDVTEAEIVEFGERWDPQPFHADPDEAEDSIFDGLIASGFHVCAMAMRVIVEEVLTGKETKGAVGVDELRWHKPVRPGDELSVRLEVLNKRAWLDGDGLVRYDVQVHADDALVLRYEGLLLWDRNSDDE